MIRGFFGGDDFLRLSIERAYSSIESGVLSAAPNEAAGANKSIA